MPFIPVTNVALCSLRGTVNGRNVSVDQSFLGGGAWTDITLNDLAEVVYNNYTTNVMPVLSEAFTMDSVHAVDLTTEFSGYGDYYPAGGISGGIAGDCMPNSIAMVVELTTGIRGRSYRGRTFWPGVPVEKVTGDLFDSDWSASVAAAQATAATGIDVNAAVLVVVSRYTDGAARLTGVATPIEHFGYSSLLVKAKRDRVRDVHR